MKTISSKGIMMNSLASLRQMQTISSLGQDSQTVI